MAVAVGMLAAWRHGEAEAAVVGRGNFEVVDVDYDVVEEHGDQGSGIRDQKAISTIEP